MSSGTVGYDTLYAAADLEDDLTVGIRSTAVRLEGRTSPPCGGMFFLCQLVLGFGTLCRRSGVAWLYWLGGDGFWAWCGRWVSCRRNVPPEPQSRTCRLSFHGKLGLLFVCLSGSWRISYDEWNNSSGIQKPCAAGLCWHGRGVSFAVEDSAVDEGEVKASFFASAQGETNYAALLDFCQGRGGGVGVAEGGAGGAKVSCGTGDSRRPDFYFVQA